MTLLALLLLAQAQVQVNIPLPVIRFEAAPPLVVVQPGIQVVPDYDDEVFFVEDHYWCRRDGRWFKSKDHHGAWVVVDGPLVPPMLVKLPPGHYRRFKHLKKELREERREDRRELKGKGKGKHKD